MAWESPISSAEAAELIVRLDQLGKFSPGPLPVLARGVPCFLTEATPTALEVPPAYWVWYSPDSPSTKSCDLIARSEISLCLSDRMAAALLAQHLGRIVGLPEWCSYPVWYCPDPEFCDGPWVLEVARGEPYQLEHHGRTLFTGFHYPQPIGDVFVPDLPDSTDPRLLADGARYVDRLALGRTCVHVFNLPEESE